MEITGVDQLAAILEQNERVVVDCFASWCGPCKRVAPLLHDLASQRPEMALVMLNVDEAEQELVTQLGVASLPTVLFYARGTQVQKIVGAKLDELRAAFTSL